MTRLYLGLPAPAKLNLLLHVLGRRADGYHDLQSVLVLTSLADIVDLEQRDDGVIERTGDIVGPLDRDLALRAALALQRASGTRLGVSIAIKKNIPAGTGLGGGSSDAATTLIALNKLWQLDWPRARLADIAITLGADVPFFFGPGPALVEGIGERISPLQSNPGDTLPWAVIVYPQVHVSTAEIFSAPGLTRSSKAVTMRALSRAVSGMLDSPPTELFGTNDLQTEVVRREPKVGAALLLLESLLPSRARMTGSGSAVFALAGGEDEAQRAAAAVNAREGFSGWAVRLLSEHPLSAW